MRRNKLKLIISILVAVVIVLIACLVIIFVGKGALDEKTAQITELQYEIDSNKQIVYVATDEIKAGETLVEGENLMKQEIFTGLEEDYYMPSDMVGGIAVLDIPALQPIMNNMVCPLEITKDTREYEIAVANLMTDQEENDYVDVRIMFPDGTDYCVLSKKNIKSLSLPNCIFYTYLNEDEILRLASATIDAYTVTGTYIYTVRYVESSLQEESIPNYVVRPEVIDLINSDPNVLNIAVETLNLSARMSLEQRLLGLSEDALTAVAAGHELQDTAKSNVYLGSDYATTGYNDPYYQDGEMTEDGYVYDDIEDDAGYYGEPTDATAPQQPVTAPQQPVTAPTDNTLMEGN